MVPQFILWDDEMVEMGNAAPMIVRRLSLYRDFGWRGAAVKRRSICAKLDKLASGTQSG